MRLLLDTHVLLWALSAPQRLAKSARSEIENPANDVMFSAASIWQIAIKCALPSGDFRVTPAEIMAAAIESGLKGASSTVYRRGPRCHTARPSPRPVCSTADRASCHRTGDALHGRPATRSLFGIGSSHSIAARAGSAMQRQT